METFGTEILQMSEVEEMVAEGVGVGGVGHDALSHAPH